MEPEAALPISSTQPSMSSPAGKTNLPLGLVYLLQGSSAFELELCTLLTCLLGSQMGPGSSPLAQMGLGPSPLGSEREQSALRFVPSPSHSVVADAFVPQLSWMHKTSAGAGHQTAKEEWKTVAAGFPQPN